MYLLIAAIINNLLIHVTIFENLHNNVEYLQMYASEMFSCWQMATLQADKLPWQEYAGKVARNWLIIKLRTNIGKILPRSCQEHKHTRLVYPVGGPTDGTCIHIWVYYMYTYTTDRTV